MYSYIYIFIYCVQWIFWYLFLDNYLQKYSYVSDCEGNNYFQMGARQVHAGRNECDNKSKPFLQRVRCSALYLDIPLWAAATWWQLFSNHLLIMLPPSSVIIAYNITLVLSLTCFGLVRGHLQRLIFKITLKPLCYADIRLHFLKLVTMSLKFFCCLHWHVVFTSLAGCCPRSFSSICRMHHIKIILKPVSEPGYLVASWWRTPWRHPPKVTIDQ
jgi:hypothetical protein